MTKVTQKPSIYFIMVRVSTKRQQPLPAWIEQNVRLPVGIGRFADVMQLSISTAPEPARQMLEDFTNMLVGRATSELFDLCEWRIEES